MDRAVVFSIFALLVFSGTLLTYFGTGARAEELGGWTSTTDYPLAVSVPCVTGLGNVYCVGGGGISPFPPTSLNKTYYASMTFSGVGSWSRTTDYPLQTGPACVAAAGYIYCLGGFKPAFTCPPPCASFSLNSSFYAPLSASGIGSWSKTTSYPKALGNIMCVTSSGYIYCTGGANNLSDTSTYVNDSYYAQISASGIGGWTTTSNIPINSRFAGSIACTEEKSYIYCNPNLFAPLTSSGIGAWAVTGGPRSGSNTCVAISWYIYCLGTYYGGGPSSVVSYARDMNPGLTPYVKTSSYPLLEGFGQYSCVPGSDRIYCVGGNVCQSAGPPPSGCKWTNAVYYADVVNLSKTTAYVLCCSKQNQMPYFYPQNLTLFVGVNNSVRWYNSNNFDLKNVSADDGSFSTGIIRSNNFSMPVIFNTPGNYPYHGVGPSPNGPAPFGGGRIRVVSAIVVTTTRVYLVTTTATTISSSVSTVTDTISSVVTERSSVPTESALKVQGVEGFAVVAVGIALAVGFVIGLKSRR